MKLKTYSKILEDYIDTPEEIINFLKDLENLYQKYDICLGHEDFEGSFILEQYSKKPNHMGWMLQASMSTDIENFIKPNIKEETIISTTNDCIENIREREYGLIVGTYYIHVKAGYRPSEIGPKIRNAIKRFNDFAKKRDIVLIGGYVDIDTNKYRDYLSKQIERNYGDYHVILTDKKIPTLSEHDSYDTDVDTFVINVNDYL